MKYSKTSDNCFNCEGPIYAGEHGYRLMDHYWCQDCIDNARETMDYRDEF